MPVEQTLRQVDQDIAEGSLGQARERLHSLVACYPDRLDLRERLAEIYWRLQYPERAGCFWYLAERIGADQQDACRMFESSSGGSAVEMLRSIRFRGDLDRLAGTHAGTVLRRLQQDALEREGVAVSFDRQPRPRYDGKAAPRRPLAAWGCLGVLLLLVYLLVAGVIQTVRWLLA